MVYVIFKYKNTYILSNGSFGSCSGCDYWEGTRTIQELTIKLERVFNNLTFYQSLSDIKFNEYTHPDMINSFNNFVELYQSS